MNRWDQCCILGRYAVQGCCNAEFPGSFLLRCHWPDCGKAEFDVENLWSSFESCMDGLLDIYFHQGDCWAEVLLAWTSGRIVLFLWLYVLWVSLDGLSVWSWLKL